MRETLVLGMILDYVFWLVADEGSLGVNEVAWQRLVGIVNRTDHAVSATQPGCRIRLDARNLKFYFDPEVLATLANGVAKALKIETWVFFCVAGDDIPAAPPDELVDG